MGNASRMNPFQEYIPYLKLIVHRQSKMLSVEPLPIYFTSDAVL